MQATQLVTVFNFKVFSRADDGWVQAPFKATRTAITRTFDGEVLEGTAEDIEPESLDADGRYRRVATGWGALD